MDLQSLFYLISIIFMSIVIIILMIFGVIIFYIKKKIESIQKLFEIRLNALYKNFVSPKVILAVISSFIIRKTIKRIKRVFKNRR